MWQNYAAAFDELPSTDTAEMLCLPANCKLAWETKITRHITTSLKGIPITIAAWKEKRLEIELVVLKSYFPTLLFYLDFFLNFRIKI